MSTLYVTEATASHAGRDGGTTRSSDGRLDLTLGIPEELGGEGGPGTNPEQLFAAGYAACFCSALNRVGGLANKSTEGSSVTAELRLVRGTGKVRFALEVTLKANLPGLDREDAEDLLRRAHEVCPYSNAIRGNVPVALEVA